MKLIEPRELQIDLMSVAEDIMLIAEELNLRWVRRKIRQAKKSDNRFSFEKVQGAYQDSLHPLITLYIQYEQWLEELKKTKISSLNNAVVQLAILGDAFRLVKDLKGFDKLVNRLKSLQEFESAAFEVEVAASYVVRGYDVEFVEEGSDRSPDLLVHGKGQRFWAECKCRDALTNRDKKVFGVWTEVEKKISQYLRSNRNNFCVIIVAKSDPSPDDVKGLEELVINLVNHANSVLDVKFSTFANDKFEFLVRKLTEPDEIIRADRFEIKPPFSLDQGIIATEMKTEVDGQKFIRNPFFIGFRNNNSPDWVTGVTNTFKSAIGQIPKKGPGVIWIRVPDVSWNLGTIDPLERAGKLLQKQLSGKHNQRINSVFLLKRVFEQFVKDGIPYLVSRPLIVRLDHQYPRYGL